MMLKRAYLAIMMAMTVLTSGLAFAAPASAACPDPYVFAIPAWYRNLQADDCSVKAPENTPTGVRDFVMKIALNVIQALMVIIAYIAIFFIIRGGFGYITSAGSPEGMTSARKTITNAVIGLIIAILAASIVNAVAGIIK